MRLGIFIFTSVVSLLPTTSFAQRPINQHPVNAPEEKDKTEWVEESVTAPAYPRNSDLIKFAMTATSNDYFVDGKSISIGADQVIRYTMVIRSDAGAENVTFEGIRCETREQKLYYLGRKDGSWGSSRSQKWREIAESGAVTYQKILMNDFFCPKKVSVKSVPEAIGALRAGVHPNVRSKSGR